MSTTKMRAKTKVRCSFCDTYFLEPDAYVNHLEEVHSDFLPTGFSGWRYYYYQKTKKLKGSCVICKNETDWNESTHKYNRFCNNPKCKEIYREEFKKRMIGKYGKVSLLDDPEQQKKMLANRKISGIYTWKDGVFKTPYTGSYELEFLKFLDLDLNFDPKDVMAPSPHTYYYTYENKKHFYIPDFFIASLGLEVEIKDGGDNPNTHHKIQDVDKVKERLKDAVMKSNKNTFSYLKIENKDHIKFLRFLTLMKERIYNGQNEKIFMP